jgi:hypothetical protein
VFCASGTEYTPDETAELPAGLGTPRPPTLPNQAGNPAFTFITIQTFLRRTHPPYDGPAVGRVCSARARPKSPLTRSQNDPPDWERLAAPTLPNQAGNPAATSISIQAFFAPDTPALRLAGRRAGVFCASETEITPDEIAELPAGLEAPRHSQHSQTRRVIRRPPPSAFKPFFAPDTPALRLAGCRAGVFCESGTEFTPDEIAE